MIISLRCRSAWLDVLCLRQGRDLVLLHPKEVEGGREAAGHRHVDHHHLPAELVIVEELGHANNHILTKYKYALTPLVDVKLGPFASRGLLWAL